MSNIMQAGKPKLYNPSKWFIIINSWFLDRYEKRTLNGENRKKQLMKITVEN